MDKLEIIGLDQESNSIICRTSKNEDFLLEINDTLKAAINGDSTLVDKFALSNATILNPKLIQQKIRAGISLTTLADETGFALRKIERYAYPILMEMDHIIELSKISPVIIKNKPTVRLETLLVEFFTKNNINYESVFWSAKREPEKNWMVTVKFNQNNLIFILKKNNNAAQIIPLEETLNMLKKKLPEQKKINIIDVAEDISKDINKNEIEKNLLSKQNENVHKLVKKNKKPKMPSWDEVLIEVKGNENQS